MPQSKPARRLAPQVTGSKLRGVTAVQARTFEITFLGQAGPVLRAEFDDCEISVGRFATTLRAALLDQSALQGLLQRISGLGLELIEVRVAAPQP